MDVNERLLRRRCGYKRCFYGSAELKDPVFLVKAPGLLVSQPLPWDPKP